MTYDSNASTTFTSLQAYKPTSLQAYKPTSLQAYKPTSLRSNYFKYLTPFLILFCSIFTVQAQNNNYLNDVVVNPPNAASLGKYGDIPVSMHTGIPNVGIPIHTMTETGGLSVPVSLSYHASGVKVAETASWVGSNWTLNAGGAITRTVRNAPDEGLNRNGSGSIRGFGYARRTLSQIDNDLYPPPGYTYDPPLTAANTWAGYLDTEPDAFNFNVGGYTGKFFIKAGGCIDPNNPVITISSSNQDVKIKPYFVQGNNAWCGRFDYWVITVPDGTKYYFGQPTANEFDGSDKAVDLTMNYTYAKQADFDVTVSAWYLTKVESADGLNSITLTYDQERYRYTNLGSEEVTDTRLLYEKAMHTDVVAAKLTRISTKWEKMDFITKTVDRKDLDATASTFFTTNYPALQSLGMARALEYIVLKDSVLTTLKKYKLETDYFVSSYYGNPAISGALNTNSDIYRLRLKSLTQSDAAETVATQSKHTFEYINTGETTHADGVNAKMPRRKSYAIDHWGFNNGRTNNGGLGGQGEIYTASRVDYGIPEYTYNTTTGEIAAQMQSEATRIGVNMGLISPLIFNITNDLKLFGDGVSGNKKPSFPDTQEGSLFKINYPTGGYTQFDYEANTYKSKVEDFKLYSQFDNKYTFANNTLSMNNGTVSLPSGTDANRIKYTAKISYFGGGSSPSARQFRTKVWRNGVLVKDALQFSINQGDLEKNFSGDFLPNFSLTDAPLLTAADNITIQIYPEPMIGNYAIDLKVFTHTLGINDNGEKVGGGMRVKTVTTSDGVNSGINIVKNYEYKKYNLPTGVAFSKPSAAQDLLVTGQSRTPYDLQYPPSNEQILPQTTDPNYNSIYNADTHPGTPYILKIAKGSILGPALNNQSSPVGYSTVIVRQAGVGYSEYTYNTTVPTVPYGIPTYPAIPEISISGQVGNLTSEIHVTEGNVVQKSVTYQYNEAIRDSAVGIIILPAGQSYGRNKRYRVRTDYNVVMTQKTEINDGVTTTTDMIYNPTWLHHNAIETTVSNSDNIPYKTKTYYAHDLTNTNLTTRNMIGIPLKTLQYINGVLKSGSQTIYSNFTTSLGTFPRPTQFQSLRRDTTTWDTKMTVNAYESTTGLPTSATRQGFIVAETYAWPNKLLTSKTFGGLVWNYEYKLNTNMVSLMIDENRLRTKFTYDALQRLQKVENRMKDDGTDIQATTLYDYHYRTNTSDNNYVSTSTSFVNATNAPPLSTKQYMDGLGRPIKVVKENYTPIALQNQVNMVTYDNIGRQDRGYLPFESTGIALVAGTPYSFPTYEASPLSRPLKQTNVDGTGVTMSYGTNAAADNIRNFVFTPVQGAAGTVTNNNVYYPAALFYKTTAWDENGTFLLPSTPTTTVGKTEMYKDKLGRTILTRKFLNGSNVDTYNVYDDYGSLVMVIPPGGLDANGNPIETLVFTYTYDSRNRLIEKKVPNADPQKFLYDNRDLLTLTQDGNMRTPAYGGAANKYLGTQYNTIGQVLKTGWVTDTAGLWAGNIIITDANKLTETQYYLNSTWVKHQGAKVLKPSGASTLREFVWSYIERRPGLTYTGNPVWTGKQHLLSKTWLNGTTEMGDAPITDNDYGGVNWTISAYDGSQKPTRNVNYIYSGPSSTHAQEVRQLSDFVYDNGQRLKQTKYDYALFGAGLVVPTYVLSDLAYNYKDQVIEKNTAFIASTGKYLQSTDFAYNSRGWLTSINSGFLSTANDYPLFTCTNYNAFNYYNGATFQTPPAQSGEDNADLFKEIIRYEGPNYTLPNASQGQYNGNISQIEWQVAGREAQAYSFKYDNLDRLTEANYADIHSGTWNTKGWTGPYETDNKFKETATYDLRGNIQNLSRTGLLYNSISSNNLLCGYFYPIDNLTYTYNPSDLNKLDKVTDASDVTKGFKTATNNSLYSYDANGNLISDLNKNITGITYNYLNLPLVISFTGNNRIEFIYDATGAKLRKTTYANNTLQETRDYVNGVEYKGGAVDRFAHTEGAVVNQAGSYVHEYTIKDHLGNARVTYSDGNNDGIVTVADIKQINHYYPFGMNMEGSWNGAAGSNKYQYNGKEWNDDFGLGLNDYGARFYDPAIGRWNAVDPLTENNPNLSPYRYCFNNPVRFIDPNGLYEVDGHYWTVYLAATVLGLSNAKDLAFYAQAPDEIMSDDGDIMSATNTWIYPKYQSSIHALTGNTAAFERFRSADWALNARGNIETGVALHRLGDSYAHSFLYWGKELMYPNGQGHLFEGHDPDKISKRPELYLKYVNNLIDILGTKFGTSRVADMFAFIYVAYTGLDTDGNSAIFETEINIRKGNQPLQVSGNQSGVINNYISARNKHYHSNTKIKTLVTEKETYTRDKKGNWQRSYGTVTLVGFED